MFRLESDSSSESETVPDSLPLEPGKSHPSTLLPSPIEILEGIVKVSESLLWCALGALIHPRKLHPLQTVQQLVLFYSISETSCSLIVLEELDSLVKTPVVGETGYPSVSVKGCPLMVVGSEFISIGSGHQHAKS